MNAKYSFMRTACRCAIASICVGFTTALLLMGLVLILSGHAAAADTVETVPEVNTHYDAPGDATRGTLMFYGKDGLTGAPVLDMNVHMSVYGMTARVTVRQEFKNPDTQWQEGIYVFPLPENAAVDHMRMTVGSRVIEGRIKEREQARAIYTHARQAGKKASLVEQERPNIFTTSVANIGPGETVTIEIQYQQIVKYEQGQFSLRFPLVVAPRYIPGKLQVGGFEGSGWAPNTDQVADAARITPPVLPSGAGKVNPVAIDIDLDPGFRLDQVRSPYHAITTQHAGATHYRIKLANGPLPADRDFVLEWRPVGAKGPRAALFREKFKDMQYALIMVLPPARESAKPINRELIFVIDTSGSMGGASIRQARAALDLALSSLRNGDRFNIIQFNSFTTQLYPYPQPVTPNTLQTAHYYVQSLRASGGTEMAPAILAALQQPSVDALLRQVVFLTDGSVGNEQRLFSIIRSNLGNSRLFTVGIGSAPNSHFMARAADFGRGTHTYIGRIDEVQEKMTALFRKIESPVLTDLTLEWPGNPTLEIWPRKIPDLYQGEPLVVTVRAATLPGHLTVNGSIAGKKWRSDISLKGGGNKEGINVLWARRKIAALMNQNSDPRERDSVRAQVLQTALEHHLVSKYTSLVAVDITPARPLEQALQQRALPVNLPAGWEYHKVFGAMPATATPAQLYLLLGLGLLLLAFMLRMLGTPAFAGILQTARVRSNGFERKFQGHCSDTCNRK